jgi:putative endonuclease
MPYYTYILASQPGGTLYIGTTNDLIRRIHEHREAVAPGFTKRYSVHRLVYFEEHVTAEQAIRREKRLKAWLRVWKV